MGQEVVIREATLISVLERCWHHPILPATKILILFPFTGILRHLSSTSTWVGKGSLCWKVTVLQTAASLTGFSMEQSTTVGQLSGSEVGGVKGNREHSAQCHTSFEN